MVSAIVVFSKLEDAKNIRNVLQRGGYPVAAVCTSGAQALSYADQLGEGLIICGYRTSDMIYSDLKECLPPDFEMILVASKQVLSDYSEGGVIALSTPLKVYDLLNTVEMVSVNFLRKKKKKKKVKERTEEEKKLLKEAKELLMERNHMTEEEAHRYLQKCSMDSGNSLVETAQMIFSLNKFMG
ncbi:MAG: ANTAR domain-containing protein [Lachnospiraceae bacterium]|nr:ANTAR domain-containing protein [Robinsoniella sp.]MDY3765528.1 ANTAR domain-containing protein [Lachnospiraceae bacterium]